MDMERLFQGSYIFREQRGYFFTVSSSSEQPLLQSNYSSKKHLLFSEELLLQDNDFFGATAFSEQFIQFTLLSSYSQQKSYFFRAKLPLSSFFLRKTNKSFFRAAHFTNLFQIKISTEELLCKSSHFTRHQVWQNSYFFNKLLS